MNSYCRVACGSSPAPRPWTRPWTASWPSSAGACWKRPTMKLESLPHGEEAQKFFEKLDTAQPLRLLGRVEQLIGLVLEATGPATSVGEICWVYSSSGKTRIQAEVVGFRNDRMLLMPLGELQGI